MNKIKLAWLTGIVEGEGCFSLASGGKNRNFFNVAISITNTDLILLKECKDIIEKMGIEVGFKRRSKEIKNRRTRYDLVIQGFGKCYKFTSILLPHLIGEKKMQAELLLQFLKRRLAIKEAGLKGWKACYTEEDNAYLKSMKALKNITESVETTRFPSQKDEDIVRTARINKGADLNRNDLSIHLN